MSNFGFSKLKFTLVCFYILVNVFCITPLIGKINTVFPEIIRVLPHSKDAFTQGLAYDSGQLYQSTGLYRHSQLQIIDLQNGKLKKTIFLPSSLFAEDITFFKGLLIQLTWREEKALVYQIHPLKKIKEITYQGEGWGLCCDGDFLWMSNGSSFLTLRDPSSFQIIKTLSITWDGAPIKNLNALECVGDFIYANVWYQENILKIDKSTGKVMAVYDCSNLLTEEEKNRLPPESSLNGIAYDSLNKTFYITGKRWPWIFEVYLN